MLIADAQREVRSVYIGGFTGLLTSAALWSLSAALGTWGSTRQAIMVLVFGGALIHPVAQLFLRLSGGPTSLSANNPMRQLALQSAWIIPLCLPLVAGATLYNRNWFYPALMIAVGAHYFPFAFLYGMPHYMALGGVLVAGGVALATMFPHSFALAGWIAAAVFALFAFPFRVVARRSLAVATVLLGCAAAVPVATSAQRDAPRNDLPQPYTTTRDWGELPPGVKWAAVTAVEPAPDGTIYVVHRCFANSCAGRSEAPILKFDRNGKLLAAFGQGMFVFPHGATVDRDGNLWLTDARGADGKGNAVIKFSPQGKVLMTLPAMFDQPTDIVVAPNGDLFVTESHRNGKNNRVAKFSRDGKFINAWGRKGSGKGELSEPHTIAIDSRGRLFVGDRENNRIVIYDQDGTVLDEWRQFGRPSGIFITRDDTIYVADSESGPDTGARELMGIKKGIRIGSARTGEVTAFIEDSESTTPDHSGAEGVGVDAQGNVYGAVVRRQMLERHVKK
jgi:sugar lactone lactonase YvrE